MLFPLTPDGVLDHRGETHDYMTRASLRDVNTGKAALTASTKRVRLCVCVRLCVRTSVQEIGKER